MSDDPKWLIEMREHHSSTGGYRIEDVYRVLGDQRVGIAVELRQPDVLGTTILQDSYTVTEDDKLPS